MDINKKTRVELKNFFKKNAIPTEGNFGDFIDAGVNQKDDGLLKPAGEPLSLEASLAATRTAIRFYETFAGNTNPSWVVSLVEPVSNQSAFVLSDALGNARLWIGQSGAMTITGLVSANAGVNVTGAPLNVGTSAATAQPLTVWGALTANSTAAVTGLLTASGGLSTTTLTATGNINANAGVNVTGAPLNVGTSAATAQPLTVWGALTANSTATVTGLLAANGGLNTTTLTATGNINANGGLTIATGKTLTANGQITATAGLVVSAGGTSGVLVGTQANPIPLTVWGMLKVLGAGATVDGIITSGGLIVNGGLSVIGSNGELDIFRRNLGTAPSTAAGDRYTWYNPDGVARLWTPVNGDLLTIKNNGFIGFGTSDPQFRLDVIGRVRLQPDTNSAGIWLRGQGASSAAAGDVSFVGLMDDNNVGFWGNNGTPGWRLVVDATTGDLTTTGSLTTKGVTATGDLSAAGLVTRGVVAAGGTLTVTGNLNVTGGAAKPGGGSWSVFSDARLKQNIEPLHNALERLLQLRGATFEWREPEKQGNLTGPQIGFIGQEVEEVFPEWIIEGDDGYKLLSIRGFEALAVEALRDLYAENQALKQSHQELQAQIAGLTRRSQTTGEAP